MGAFFSTEVSFSDDSSLCQLDTENQPVQSSMSRKAHPATPGIQLTTVTWEVTQQVTVAEYSFPDQT